jgi:hypothetical protein
MNRGFTIFFAMLVGSLALSVGFAIYDLTVREIDLSAAASQSQYAIYAADTGAECALYWDSKYAGSGTAFGTSTGATWGTSVICNSQDIAAMGTPPVPIAALPTGWSAWTKATTATAATTTFTLTLLPAQPYCAVVDVGKATVGGILFTTIISRGYNNCGLSGAARLERTLKVSY